MRIPSSTYRVQLNGEFTFRHLENILGYISDLGISTIYAAPVLKSTPGSVHGYDVIDPHQIDPEIGTLEDFRRLSSKLKEKGITWLQDIVPNHMAFHTGNQRLMDVLERGDLSEYRHYFDISWDHHEPLLKGKVCVPFLGREVGECIKEKEIRLSFSTAGFTINYFDTAYPLSVAAYELLPACPGIKKVLGELYTQAKNVSALREWLEIKASLIGKAVSDPVIRCEAQKLCNAVNEDPIKLCAILDSQYYRLMYWKHSEKQINYRRFFTVNELICLRMEARHVFDEYHRLILQLYDEGLIQGVRIDHIDGLFDPSVYVKRLRLALGNDCYMIAEKILEPDEKIPEQWPLQGTSGYEFLSYVSQLYTDRIGSRKLVDLYQDIVPAVPPYKSLVLQNKKLMLENYMSGEWENLTELFFRRQLHGGHERERIRIAISLFMISIPVYRIYPDKFPLRDAEISVLTETFRQAIENGKEYEPELTYLKELLTGSLTAVPSDDVLYFLKRVMQFTGPLTAKGVEDTTFYVYNPLISHDEVGDAPSTLGISVQAFHKKMELRQRSTPLSLNATATHDTKRGEDARLRLNVLSEMPEVWEKNVRNWMEINKPYRVVLGDVEAPSANDEYFIYQSLLGGLPGDSIPGEEYFNRFREYLTKALREAKVFSNWAAPNEEYEEACVSFTERIFTPDHAFSESFLPFVQIVTRYANIHALGQVLIKITAPGIPDMYQGSGLWDLSYVDPDNRRPVDFEKRMQLLDEIRRQEKKGIIPLFEFLRSARKEGAEKLFVTWKSLMLRKKLNDVFISGEYLPLQVMGKNAIVISYARHYKGTWVVVIVPLGLAKNRETDQPYAEDPDDRLFVSLPGAAPSAWRNAFTDEELQSEGKLMLFEAFKDFPVALLTGSTENKKRDGFASLS